MFSFMTKVNENIHNLKKQAANEVEEDASDTNTTVSRASTMCKQIVEAARTHRGMPPKPEMTETGSFF